MAVLAACSSTAGSAHPVPGALATSQAGGGPGGPSTSVSSGGDRLPGGAPRVKKPLDSAKFQAAPCSVLSQPQLASMSVGVPGKARLNGPVGPTCDWQDNITEIGLGGAFALPNTEGLDSLYSQDRDGQIGLFEPLPEIAGHPAVIFSGVDQREIGSCAVAVGLTDQLNYSVVVTLGSDHPTRSDPCPVARRAVELAMETMTGGR
ncbi:DUF3558 domain-containing protein [Actinokineospora sp.]|uniref:DUF3558 domain-containing protein n=1 Tax=Actinokineospora sp. TaxID=1872133 RepID=UPI0040378B76